MSIYDKALKGLLRKCSILHFKDYGEFKKKVSTLSNDEIEWLKELSKTNSYAQFNLGYMYRHGLGVDKDLKEAVRLFGLSAGQGYSFAQLHLGCLYKKGLGVEKDYKEAVRLFRLSADQCNQYAQCNLGYMYHYCLGVEKDYKEAVRLYRLSADQGYSEAQNNLNRLSNNL